MALSKILLDIATELGIDITSDTERAWIVEKINDAAREIYESDDIPGCLRELTFNIDDEAQESSLVSLPGYIDKIRGLRWTSVQGGKIPQNDMRPRYHLGKGWGANAFSLPFRTIREVYPLKRDISNASILTFTIPVAEATDITITIVGRTNNSDRFSETVVIPAGDLTVDTVGNYEEVHSILKAEANLYNITITDVEDNNLGVINNGDLSPAYKILELIDGNLGPQVNYGGQTAIDILYKTRFTPFVNLADEFPCPNCDRILFYKFAEYYLAQQPGRLTDAMAASAKADILRGNLNVDNSEGKELELQFGRNGLLEAQNPYNNLYMNSRRLW
jgi:hypothetical protein